MLIENRWFTHFVSIRDFLFYALGRQKILPGLKANFCCPALQFHRSY